MPMTAFTLESRTPHGGYRGGVLRFGPEYLPVLWRSSVSTESLTRTAGAQESTHADLFAERRR